jgi:hypothetical protein
MDHEPPIYVNPSGMGSIHISPTAQQGTAVARKPFFVSPGHGPPLPPPPMSTAASHQNHPPPADSNVLKDD